MSSKIFSVIGALLTVLLFATEASALETPPERPLLKRKVLAEKPITDFPDVTSAKPLSPDVIATNGVPLDEVDITFPARAKDPAAQLWSGKANLSEFDLIRFDARNMAAERVQAFLTLDDGSPKKSMPLEFWLDPGANTIAFPLWAEGLDLSKLSAMSVSIKAQASAVKIHVSKILAQKVFADRTKLWAFTFGEAHVAGAIPVTAKTMFEAGKPFGLSGTDIAARVWQGEFGWFGSSIAGTNLAFQAALPQDDYEVQTVAFGVDWQGVRSQSFKIVANDAIVVDKPMTPEKFYSFDGQYYGANIFYDPKRSLFDQYHRKYFEAEKFEAKPAAGTLTLKFENCGVRALWIYPKALAQEGREFVDCCYGEEAYNLWMKHARVRDHAPAPNTVNADAKDQQRGYMLFARNYQYRVYPNSLPAQEEVIHDGLNVACAANEYEPVTFVVRPLKDLGAVKVTVSDLAGEGQTIPASSFEKFIVKYFPQQVSGVFYEAVPTVLYPYFDMELKQDWNCQYWMTMHVPAGTPGGAYKGKISIQPANGEATELPLSVTVFPFDLPKTKTECGAWNNTALGSHGVHQFPNNDELAAKLLDAECKNMAEHGLNCYCMGGPAAKSYDANGAVLDFHNLDLIAAALNKNGMTGRHMLGTDGLNKYGLQRKGFKEFSPEWNAAYRKVMSETHDWMVKNKVNAVLQVTDEPRETELEEWNHNRRDTIKLLKLAREIPGMQTMVTLMGDHDGFNRPYSAMVPLMDVMATHSWPGSDNIIFLSAVEHIADYWAYNNGFTRFAHGFYLWKSKALGHWQWVYSWEVCNAHIPVMMPHDSSGAYIFPGGFLNTLKFENTREGIDDHRYLELLETTLAGAPKDSAAAKDAKAFLTVLEKFLPEYPADIGQTTGAEAGGTYDESKSTTYFDPWRKQIAEYIMALKENRAAKKIDAAWSMFPQQALVEDRKVICKLVAKGPVIDGKGSDPVWKDATEVTDFVNLARGVIAPIQTHVKSVCDGEKIYFLFTCNEPKFGELKAYAINRDDACWEDDSVEMFLDVLHDKTTYKHIIVNCLGTIEDGDGRDDMWNGDIQTAVSKEKGVWRVEVSATVKSLGAETPKDGTVWGVNLCRNRQPQPPETSSWAFVGNSFHNPSKFGTMEFKK